MAPPPESASEPLDLHTLLSQFVALRHEINLLTRASRSQMEQNAQALQQLGQAVQALQATPRDTGDGDASLRPLLKTLVELADALGLARREVQRGHEALAVSLARLTEAAASLPPPAPPAVPFWKRLFGGQEEAPEWPAVEPQAEEAAAHVRRVLDSIVVGYTMSLQRVERALQQYGLEPIPATGQPFDPERMEVLEAVPDSGRPTGEVLEEVRPGYLWQGRVFRPAQVRVAR